MASPTAVRLDANCYTPFTYFTLLVNSGAVTYLVVVIWSRSVSKSVSSVCHCDDHRCRHRSLETVTYD